MVDYAAIAALERLHRPRDAILQQEANMRDRQEAAQSEATRAAGGLDTVKAQLLPGESAANIGLSRAQAGLFGSQSAYQQALADTSRAGLPYVGPRAAAEIGQINSGARVNDATAYLQDVLTAAQPQPEGWPEPTARGLLPKRPMSSIGGGLRIGTTSTSRVPLAPSGPQSTPSPFSADEQRRFNIRENQYAGVGNPTGPAPTTFGRKALRW